MSTVHELPDGTKSVSETSQNEAVSIMDKVDYVYTNFTQFALSNVDFRIAIGDLIPPKGTVKPITGIVMTHEHARTFLKVMSAHIALMDKVLADIVAKATEKAKSLKVSDQDNQSIPADAGSKED